MNHVRRATNAGAAEYMDRRWRKSRVLQWDYRMTRRTLLEELKPEPGDRVLEIGCGPGTWTREVANECGELVAVDISEGMIEQARHYTRSLPITFIRSDFATVELIGQFDKIFSVRAIEYMPDRDLLAQKISQSLAPGGRVVLITKTRFSLWRGRSGLLYRTWPFSRLTSGGKRRRSIGHRPVRQYLPSPGQLADAFSPYGLRIERVRPVVLRLPMFRDGFHEIPIVPESLAPPLLALFQALYAVGSCVPASLSWAPLFLSESYAVTLQSSEAPHAGNQLTRPQGRRESKGDGDEPG